MGVPYYVDKGFEKVYHGAALDELEKSIESDYIEHLQNGCWKEKQQSKRAWSVSAPLQQGGGAVVRAVVVGRAHSEGNTFPSGSNFLKKTKTNQRQNVFVLDRVGLGQPGAAVPRRAAEAEGRVDEAGPL